jgi:hercynylcysteine S-oxide lyase
MVTRHGRNELYKQPPPPFGHALLKYYALDPEYINLNNGSVLPTVLWKDSLLIFGDLGSYGTTPKPVLEAVKELTLEIESNPDLFHRLTYQKRLNAVREKLARLIGAKTDEVVLVTNASTGINTILRNFEWEHGDQIFVCT